VLGDGAFWQLIGKSSGSIKPGDIEEPNGRGAPHEQQPESAPAFPADTGRDQRRTASTGDAHQR